MSAAYAGPDCELRPDAAMMMTFCDWWFRHVNQGVLEIGWMNAQTGKLTEFAQFERDDVITLAATAVQANMVSGQSVYIRAATVRAHAFPPYTEDADFVQAPGIWSDIDKPEDIEKARTVSPILRPNAQVITGTVPAMRVQSWFRTSEPIVSPTMVRDLNVRLHRLYGGDSSVVNPSRLMRLPGTIAWPWKDLEHRVPELVRLALPGPEDNRPASYPVSMLTSQLPRDEAPAVGMPPSPGFIAGLSTVSSYLSVIRSGNNWHNAMIRLVAHWVGKGWSSTEIHLAAQSFTLPGYTIAQTQVEVAKAIEGARNKWGVPDQESVIATEPSKPFGDHIFDPWGELEAPAFPVECLPDVLRNYVESRARIMGADPCALTWSALSAASAALDGRTRLKMKKHDNWLVPPALWVALIGRSSSKKTPVIMDTWRPLEALQTVALRAYADQVAHHNALPKEERKDTPQPPRPRRLITHDATMESIQDILAGQDRGIGMLRDELSGFIGSFDKYTNGGKGGADRAFFLQAYNGGSHVVDRVGRGTVAINNLLVTICGGIQPERLAKFNDLTDDGMWQRFVPIIVGPGGMGTDESDTDAMNDFTLRLQGIVDASHGDVASLSEAAHLIRHEVERDAFALETAEPLGSRFASFTGKLAGLFGRLCLVLSYLEPRGLGYIVSKETAERARILIRKCVVPHAARVYMTMGDTDSSLEITRSIAGFILTRKLQRVVISDLTRGVRACRNHGVPEVVRMISPLIAGGWLLPETEIPGNRAWSVNPAAHVNFANRTAQESRRRSLTQDILGEENDC